VNGSISHLRKAALPQSINLGVTTQEVPELIDDPATNQFLQLLGQLTPAQRAAIHTFGYETKADPFTAAYTLAAAMGYGDRHAARCANEWQSMYAPTTIARFATPSTASSSADWERPANGYDYQGP
jgi:hypothetical protein